MQSTLPLIHTPKIIRLNYERCLFQATVIRPRSIYWLACYRYVSISISNKRFSKKKIMQVIIKKLAHHIVQQSSFVSSTVNIMQHI